MLFCCGFRSKRLSLAGQVGVLGAISLCLVVSYAIFLARRRTVSVVTDIAALDRTAVLTTYPESRGKASSIQLVDRARPVVVAVAMEVNDNVSEPESLQATQLENLPLAGHRLTDQLTPVQPPSSSLKNQNVSYSVEYSPSSFPLDDSYSLPFQGTVMPSSLQSVEWPKTLKNFIQHLQSPRDPVVLVAADDAYRSALINWLISSQMNLEAPLQNVLIVTYNDKLCLFLASKHFNNCLSVPISTVMQASALQYFKHHRHMGMLQLLIIRVIVMRILNRWGFDAANFDSDAIILRNPLPLFRKYPDTDMVGTYGGGLPKKLQQQWGLVLCMGAILVRSTVATGKKYCGIELVWYDSILLTIYVLCVRK